MNRIPKRGAVLLVLVFIAMLMGVFVPMSIARAGGHEEQISTLADLRGKKIGIENGTAFDQLIEKNLDGVNNFQYFNSIGDLVAALQSGKIDAFIGDEPQVNLAVARNKGIAVLPEEFMEDNYGFVFRKGSALTDEFNQALAKLRTDGILDELKDKWTGSDESAKTIPEQDWDTSKGTLTMAVENSAEPMAYVTDGKKTVGYCVDLALLICKECGYGLKVDTMPFSSELAAVQSGKADFGGGNVSITEERKQTLDFSEPSYDGAATFAVRATSDATKNNSSSDTADLEIKTIAETAGKKIGMLSGTAFDQLLLEKFEGMSQNDFLYFNSNSEIVGALMARKVDVMVSDLPIAELAVRKNEGIGIIPEPYMEDHYAYVLQKDSPLTDKVNGRLAAYKENGTIDALREKWMAKDDSGKTMPEQDWEAPNGTITIATSVDNEPLNYLVNNEPGGMCIELIELIARDLGYKVEFTTTNSGSLIAEVQAGKADIAAYSFSITEERKKMVDMSEPFFDGGVTAVVRTTTAGSGEEQGFLASLAASFERTFITENRWQLVLSGLAVTLLISVASGSAGLALGFLFVLLRRKKEGGLADKLISMLEKLLGGLPVVVVLMVFYYLIFGGIDISGMVVAILAFTLIFGASCGTIMWNAIRAVDIGQTEAGRALGFGDRDTFFLVVLPQAARNFAPLLLGQFVSLVKDTSIVGYIAVQDLTRVGDLIRARTMEAFFPLIAIAIIYFALCRLLAWLMGFLIKKLEPKDGPRSIKGVEL